MMGPVAQLDVQPCQLRRIPSFSKRPGFPTGLRVLLVEGQASTRQRLVEQLEQLSYKATPCASAVEASQELGSAFFDVVVVETQAVASDNAEGRRLRQAARERGLPLVLMCERSSSPEEVLRGIELGAADVLEKPLSKLKLQNIWQHVVRKMLEKPEASHSDMEDVSPPLPAPLKDSSSVPFGLPACSSPSPPSCCADFLDVDTEKALHMADDETSSGCVSASADTRRDFHSTAFSSESGATADSRGGRFPQPHVIQGQGSVMSAATSFSVGPSVHDRGDASLLLQQPGCGGWVPQSNSGEHSSSWSSQQGSGPMDMDKVWPPSTSPPCQAPDSPYSWLSQTVTGPSGLFSPPSYEPVQRPDSAASGLTTALQGPSLGAGGLHLDHPLGDAILEDMLLPTDGLDDLGLADLDANFPLVTTVPSSIPWGGCGPSFMADTPPLGLSLKKSQSLLDLINAKLAAGSSMAAQPCS